MESNDFQSMSVDELWNLHQEITAKLAQLVTAERTRLHERLRKIEEAGSVTRLDRVRRPYPTVLPKYKNPKNPVETWSGRGKQPRWLAAQLQAGRGLEDFLIDRASVQECQWTA